MIRAVLISSLCMLMACKGKKDVAQTTAPYATPKPSWVSQRPVDAFNYVGIGLAIKARGDQLEVAKKNALNDLASEIKVKVEGNSLLYTLERKYEFQEEFTSSIQTSTSEELEGYELVDTWENGTEYWNYYRLSRSEHARSKAAKQKKAIDQAKDLHLRSRSARMSGDLRTALDMDLRSLLALRDYWGEENKTELDGKEVYLANELYNDLQSLFTNISLTLLPERCELSLANDFEREMLVSAMGHWNGVSVPLRQLPIVLKYQGVTGPVVQQKNSDQDGQVRITVQHVDPILGRKLAARVNTEELISNDLDLTFTRPLISSMPLAVKECGIDLMLPKVFLQADESNLGAPVTDGGLSSTLREEMTAAGFRFVNSEGQADMRLKLKASTRQGGSSNGFFTSFLDMSISLIDARTQEVITETGEQGVKGVQLTYEKAGSTAYSKARQLVKKDVVPSLISSLL